MIMRCYLFYLFALLTWRTLAGQETPLPTGTPIDLVGPIEGLLEPAARPSLQPAEFGAVSESTLSPLPTKGPSIPPTLFPTLTRPPTELPSIFPTNYPTLSNPPSVDPSMLPSLRPSLSEAPSIPPSRSIDPSNSPSNIPTELPSNSPSLPPTDLPSIDPTNFPTVSPEPSASPSNGPTVSREPSDQPSNVPSLSLEPSRTPSMMPTWSSAPSGQPSVSNEPSISIQPSETPSDSPSDVPSLSAAPSNAPSSSHAPSVSEAPSDQPSDIPSDVPSAVPTVSPFPSSDPSESPSALPSAPPSEAPSSIPSQAPSFLPVTETRDVGMFLTGLVERFNRGGFRSRAFEELACSHMIQYWETASQGGTVVYNCTAVFNTIQRPPRAWRLNPETLQNFQAAQGVRRHVMELDSRQFTFDDLLDLDNDNNGDNSTNATSETNATLFPVNVNVTPSPSPTKVVEPSTDAPSPAVFASFFGNGTGSETDEATSESNETITPFPFGTGGGLLAPSFAPFSVNQTFGEDVFQDVVSNETGFNNLTDAPTFQPTSSRSPSIPPSWPPSVGPTTTPLPSEFPTSSFMPSATPTDQPLLTTWVVWYSQEITYGERFSPNDTRTNSIYQVFSFPYLLDQKSFTNQLINITRNQLQMYVVDMEVRDGSTAPSIQPSEFPSETPSVSPTFLPTLQPTGEPPTGIGTRGVIIAVTVPVTVVLLIVFAGIIYVTRVDHDQLNPEGSYLEDVVLSVAGAETDRPVTPQPPGSQPLGPPSGLDRDVSYGTPATEPLIDTSEILRAAQQQQLPPPDTTTLGAGGEHPAVVMTTTPRRPSSASIAGSAVSGIASLDDPRGSQRAPAPIPTPQGIPGYMSPTGTFTPVLAPIPSPTIPGAFGTHSRDPSLQGSDTSGGRVLLTPLGRSALSRAATTGGIAPGRVSPFQGRIGGIPTIPTTQLGVQDIQSPLAGSIGGVVGVGGVPEDLGHPGGVSESEEPSESEDHPSLTAFGLDVQEIDDFLE